MDTSKVFKFAKQSGVDMRHSKGSHVVLSYGGKTVTAVDHGSTMSRGVAAQGWKFFQSAGLIAILISVMTGGMQIFIWLWTDCPEPLYQLWLVIFG
jgi:hypothetical protein